MRLSRQQMADNRDKPVSANVITETSHKSRARSWMEPKRIAVPFHRPVCCSLAQTNAMKLFWKIAKKNCDGGVSDGHRSCATQYGIQNIFTKIHRKAVTTISASWVGLRNEEDIEASILSILYKTSTCVRILPYTQAITTGKHVGSRVLSAIQA